MNMNGGVVLSRVVQGDASDVNMSCVESANTANADADTISIFQVLFVFQIFLSCITLCVALNLQRIAINLEDKCDCIEHKTSRLCKLNANGAVLFTRYLESVHALLGKRHKCV